jgi:hypothetical protein
MTVGQLRELIANVPDDYTVRPQWVAGKEPKDHEPGVRLERFDVDGQSGELLARVSLFYLDEIEDEEDE